MMAGMPLGIHVFDVDVRQRSPAEVARHALLAAWPVHLAAQAPSPRSVHASGSCMLEKPLQVLDRVPLVDAILLLLFNDAPEVWSNGCGVLRHPHRSGQCRVLRQVVVEAAILLHCSFSKDAAGPELAVA